ncbi:serine/threonine-protein kinase [Polyangium jinanense]|uniref:Serine/threonine protein kinase n=1 Tax=Polyangium jinanense TaxID=2829994 RepID=A0A9X3X2U7_9BACT|nr:serine/threonine-protein kinase [Polyangium jinanense]MDC3957292.1 serine/threonine protein kinase [Polyangium jinanense]MDC3982694.1 serine/threonine protein kinase [Polyangium jinanense]
MSQMPVKPGDLLARKYRVERVLGSGAMGVVVAARHVDLGQLVAVKSLLTGRVVSPEQRERFLREARAAVLLKSHHVARVLDVGADENDAPYIVMEYLDGQDLAATLKARRQLPFEEAVELVLQACEAVGEAHAAGIVHRDLKPANLFLTQDVSGAPCVKVLDFGISKLMGSDVALTHESQMLGSPLYMSPEQMNTPKSVDARSDVWALGIILYQLVCGKTPFHAETIQAVCALVIAGQPTPLRQYRADAPAGFEAVILRCLARNREERFRDVGELAAALAPYAPAHARVYVERVGRVVASRGSRGGSSAEIVVAAVTAAEATVPLAASPAPVVASSGRKRPVSVGVLIASGVLAAVVAGLLVVFVLMKRPAVAEPEARAEASAAAGAVAKAQPAMVAEAVAVDAGADAADEPAAPPLVSPARDVSPVKVAPPPKPLTPAKAAPRPAKRNDDLYNP